MSGRPERSGLRSPSPSVNYHRESASMGINRDHIDRNSLSDAPQDWERYARMLREHGRKLPEAELAERLEKDWDRRLAARRRTQGRLRIIAPLATLVVAAAGFFIVSDTALHKAALEPRVAEDPVLPILPDERPQRFAAPEIPPVWIDTNLPFLDAPSLPGMADPSLLRSWADSLLHREPPVAGE